MKGVPAPADGVRVEQPIRADQRDRGGDLARGHASACHDGVRGRAPRCAEGLALVSVGRPGTMHAHFVAVPLRAWMGYATFAMRKDCSAPGHQKARLSLPSRERAAYGERRGSGAQR